MLRPTLLAALLASSSAAQCLLHLEPAPQPADWVRFGAAVALDGTRAAVGAPGDDDAGLDAGAVWILEPAGASWVGVQKLVPSQGDLGAQFGIALDLEGDVLVVGAPYWQGGVQAGGAAWVYERTPAGWVEAARLLPQSGEVGDHFGGAVAVDGEQIVVGAFLHDGAAPASGSAFVFERSAGPGTPWVEVQQLSPPSLHADDAFGWELALDDGTLFVGAPWDNSAGQDHGSTFVYERNAAGSFELVQTLVLPGGAWQHHGEHLALLGDRALVGAELEVAVHVLERGPNGQWTTITTLGKPTAQWSAFGEALALGPDEIYIAAPGAQLSTGRVHRYRLREGDWSLDANLLMSGGQQGDVFGSALAVAGSLALVGVPGDSDSAFSAGAISLHGLSLCADESALSLAAGGTQSLKLDVGDSHANATYAMLGSLSGAQASWTLDGWPVPLLPDDYTDLLLSAPQSAPLSPAQGLLDAGGRRDLVFALPAGSDPALAGVVVHHAALVVELGATPGTIHVSNAFPLQLLP